MQFKHTCSQHKARDSSDCERNYVLSKAAHLRNYGSRFGVRGVTTVDLRIGTIAPDELGVAC